MRMQVTEIEEPGPEDGQELPVVHFRGRARSLDEAWRDNAYSELRGTYFRAGLRRGTNGANSMIPLRYRPVDARG